MFVQDFVGLTSIFFVCFYHMAGFKKSLQNVFRDRGCLPKMAMVIDDRLQVWDDKDQPRVHVVPAYTPYYAPQAEVHTGLLLNELLCWTYAHSGVMYVFAITNAEGKCCSGALCGKKCCMQCSWWIFQVCNKVVGDIYLFELYLAYCLNIDPLFFIFFQRVWWQSDSESVWNILRKWFIGSTICSRCWWLLSLRGSSILDILI